MFDGTWLSGQVATCHPDVPDSAAVAELWTLLRHRAEGFAALRPDVGSSRILPPRRGLQHDESASFVDHGWAADRVGFERGEFDAVAFDAAEQVVLVMEAKARTTGPDSLDKLAREWMRFAAEPAADLDNNAGRKWRELVKLSADHPVSVLLVADGSRWILDVRQVDGRVVVRPV
jgi:hypothetical protein